MKTIKQFVNIFFWAFILGITLASFAVYGNITITAMQSLTIFVCMVTLLKIFIDVAKGK